MIVDLFDESGINLSQVAIGHEITAIVDGDTQNTLILNDLFRASTTLDSRSGTATIQLNDLAPGSHTVEIRAFDIANNLSTVELSFIVDDELNSEIFSFEVFPNPAPAQQATIRFSLTHDVGNINSTSIDVYNLQGRFMREIEVLGPFADNFITYPNSSGIDLSALSSGSYICRAVIETTDGEILNTVSKMLQILK